MNTTQQRMMEKIVRPFQDFTEKQLSGAYT
jgi:hypothetical protein